MAKPEKHSQEQVKAFLAELKTQTDRGAAVIAAAVLDDLLKILLVARFVELSGERREALFDKMGAPLSSFSSKIEMAYAVGVVGNHMRLALHLIREVRNEFAHRIEQISFDHPDVATKLKSRILPDLAKMGRSPRQNFIDTFSAAAMMLYATVATDIRLKNLGESNPGYFMEFMGQVAGVFTEANSPPKAPTPGAESSYPKQE